MSRLRWPDSTNSVSEKPGTIHIASDGGLSVPNFVPPPGSTQSQVVADTERPERPTSRLKTTR